MKAFWRDLHARHPGFRIAVTEDVRVTSLHRGEMFEAKSGWQVILKAFRLMWVSDAFFAHVCYRLRMRLLARGVPIIPRLLHKISMATSQISIGDPVLMHPGIYFPHGQVVLDGLVEIKSGTVIAPWVSIGLVAGIHQGPTIGHDCFIGTGSSLLGPFKVGDKAIIGSGAVVTKDVAEGTMVVGIPAKPVGTK
ncbi:MAG: hypothetical protein IPK93_03870 [Solirubrobacterales bacterium]|nr:hypothetical protein [Solirubrobacterales bacterium]